MINGSLPTQSERIEQGVAHIFRPSLYALYVGRKSRTIGKSGEFSKGVGAVKGWEGITLAPASHGVNGLVKPERSYLGNHRNVVPAVGGLNEKDSVGLKNAANLKKYVNRGGQVFKDVISKNNVKGFIVPRKRLAKSDFGLIEIRVVENFLRRVNSGDVFACPAKVHLGYKARTSTKIKNNGVWVNVSQDTLSEKRVVPITGVCGIESPVPTSYGHCKPLFVVREKV